MIKKIKRNWKRIILIGAGTYVAVAIISTAVGAAFIKGRMDKIENCEDEIGKAFVERKSDFQERFNKNWNAKRDSLIEGFKRTEKHSDKHGLDGLKGALEIAQKMLNNSGLFAWEGRPEPEKTKLEQEIAELEHYIASGEAAFKKKWFSQRDNETLEQLERRQDEGGIDWQVEYIARCEWRIKDLTDEFELDERNQNLIRENTHLTHLQEKFQEKYGEPYDGTEFREACVVLQEQARKETQEFLANVAAKRAEEQKRKELIPMSIARDAVISQENGQCRSPEKSYLGLRHLHTLLDLYAQYNGLVVAFEEKWGVEAEEPLREYKAECDRYRSLGERDRFSTEWGLLPVDYMAKEKELEELLPKVELEFDRQFIAGLRERISDHENEIQKLQKDYEDLNRDWGNHDRKVRLQNEMEAAKSDFKNLEIDVSILSLEEAFEKKWSPQTEEETIEQFERRQSEGNIQFLAAFIERSKIDGENSYPADDVLSQAKESFFEKYGEVCPEANLVNVATN